MARVTTPLRAVRHRAAPRAAERENTFISTQTEEALESLKQKSVESVIENPKTTE
ncbi:hypothetical protein KIN20_019585 [Parelaphostrongylus tenuis]|uniref:Uncharacterized protein n=1 Tax=Parelaphostrongylus tenuis TaxID=148309 RepID=A0AAD5N502_PARTN|nr:hypothetical protein KIN20_019585 [Parelaphostrongylus tenuis]